MNCESFKAMLHEYLDETLQPDVQAAARKHLQQCRDCRRSLAREEAFAKFIEHSLDRATAGLSLRPDIFKNVVTLKSRSSPSSGSFHALQTFISTAFRPARAIAALACFLLLLVGIQFFRRTDPSPKTTAQAREYSSVIHIPITVQTHVFEHQNNTVVDAIVTGVAVGHARFVETKKPGKIH